MKNNSLIYNNSLMEQGDFINNILNSDTENELPTYEIKETLKFYYINVTSFYGDKHILELSSKNDFLILKIKFKNALKKSPIETIFYLADIDLNNILLIDNNHNLKLIIPKLL
ncbi:hypothetical protein [Clostridium sp. C2-6-12]|uniref:hypothetical protein n=1 Tax=Clostridium sp. C2-6-12 TaxID=2698832 RepID=UPI0013688656|nr:hypothetical protein [Clostridium sp. C2-6-12]